MDETTRSDGPTTPDGKVCPKCARDLPAENYYRDRRTRDGLYSACKTCHGARVKRWKVEHSDFWLAYQQQWREDNREYFREYFARYRAEQPEKVRAAQLAYYSVPEHHEERRRQLQERRRSNPIQTAEYKQRRRTRKLALTVGPTTPELLAAKSAYWAHRCWMCGAKATAWDHVKPLSKGGAHMIANLRPACQPCNSAKGNRWPFHPSMIRRAA